MYSGVTYSITQFNWNGKYRTFFANSHELIPSEGDYKVSFPNGKKQFMIKNYETGGFRRFRYEGEVQIFTDEDYLPNGEIAWEFKSEDGISCFITLFPDEIK
jgi:hypothetical protein